MNRHPIQIIKVFDLALVYLEISPSTTLEHALSPLEDYNSLVLNFYRKHELGEFKE